MKNKSMNMMIMIFLIATDYITVQSVNFNTRTYINNHNLLMYIIFFMKKEAFVMYHEKSTFYIPEIVQGKESNLQIKVNCTEHISYTVTQPNMAFGKTYQCAL